MARTQTIPKEHQPIYAPGFSGQNDWFSKPSDYRIQTAPHHALEGLTFGRLSITASAETTLAQGYFISNFVAAQHGLADPYATAAGEDPFEYRSVPVKIICTLDAKLEWTGPIPPTPIDDE